MSPPPPARLPEGQVAWRAAYAAAWVPILAIYTALFVQMGATPFQAARGAAFSVVPAALLGVPLVSLSISPPQSGGLRLLAAHLARGAAFIAAVASVWALLRIADFVVAQGSFGAAEATMLVRNVGWQALLGILFYAVLAAIGHSRADGARWREQRDRAAHAEALRARAELSALRSQLNPHFILNALHTLLALVRRDPPRAEEAIDRLGGLLTYGLRMHRDDLDVVPLGEEWRFVADYARIEQLRFGERLRVAFDADPEALAGLAPPFSVQPLLENAIQHGITPRADGGTVTVSARARDGRLHILVEDDGQGLAAAAPTGTGLGLRLLQERLRALYGGRATLRLEPRPGGGTRAALELPAGEEHA